MDLFGAGATPREHKESRVLTGDDAWAAAVLGGDLALASVNREAARRAGLRERVAAPAWAALAFEALAHRAFGEGTRVVALDLRYLEPLHVDDEVALALVPLVDAAGDLRARVEARRGAALAVEGTLTLRVEEERA